jgi:hypothetical protein
VGFTAQKGDLGIVAMSVAAFESKRKEKRKGQIRP